MNAISHQRLEALEVEMAKCEQIPCPVKHYFSPQGVYAREIFIPAGTIVTGRIHKYAQLNILSSGELSVLLEHGIERVKAPFTVVSPPGTKRIVYAHTDVTWTTIFATELTDADEIEQTFTVATEREYLSFVESQKLIGNT